MDKFTLTFIVLLSSLDGKHQKYTVLFFLQDFATTHVYMVHFQSQWITQRALAPCKCV